MQFNLIEFNLRNTISLILLIASFVLLFFGVTEPMLTMKAELMGRELFNYKRSIGFSYIFSQYSRDIISTFCFH